MAQEIGFFHDIDNKKYWKDGLWAALEILKKDYKIVPFKDCDINIVWSPAGKHLPLQGKVIWLYAGGQFQSQDAITVVEDDYSVREFKKIGVDAIKAFGVNTDLFKFAPLEKKWDVIFPAAFAKWKRHHLLVDWCRGKSVLCVGFKQQVETECYQVCLDAGFDVLDRVTPEELSLLYNQSRECYIPSEIMGGSQRTLMEALSCGLPVKVAPDNERLQEMLTQPLSSHFQYVEKLKAIINGFC